MARVPQRAHRALSVGTRAKSSIARSRAHLEGERLERRSSSSEQRSHGFWPCPRDSFPSRLPSCCPVSLAAGSGGSSWAAGAGYLKKRSFVPVGNPLSRTLSARLHTSCEFPALLHVKEDINSVPVQETVVALYDYTAHRSDELTIHCSDIIQVLYKDNDNWWFGTLMNGQQGYFPANYVVGESQLEEQLCSRTAEDSSPLLFTEPVEAASPAMPQTSAVINKSRDLRLISENDTKFQATQGPKKKTKKQDIQMNETEFQANNDFTSNSVEEQSRKDITKKKKKSTVKARASGTSNNAFVPDILQA